MKEVVVKFTEQSGCVVASTSVKYTDVEINNSEVREEAVTLMSDAMKDSAIMTIRKKR